MKEQNNKIHDVDQFNMGLLFIMICKQVLNYTRKTMF